MGFSEEPSDVAAFKIEQHTLSATWLGEELLSRLLNLENLVLRRVLSNTGIDEAKLQEGLELGAAFEDNISYGKGGPILLGQAIDAYEKAGIPMKEAFFVLNAQGIVEDMRHALMAACFHFGSLNSRIKAINQTGPRPHL